MKKMLILVVPIVVMAMLACGLPVATEEPVEVALVPEETLEPTPTETAVPTPTNTPKPTPVVIPGITEPIVIRGVDLIFTSVSRTPNFQLPDGNTMRPNPPYNTLVVVEALSGATNINAPCEWRNADIANLSWVRPNGEEDNSDWGVCSSNMEGHFVQFFFASYNDAGEFVLRLPDGNVVDLSSLGSGSSY